VRGESAAILRRQHDVEGTIAAGISDAVLIAEFLLDAVIDI
jgi:hypothetical protein